MSGVFFWGGGGHPVYLGNQDFSTLPCHISFSAAYIEVLNKFSKFYALALQTKIQLHTVRNAGLDKSYRTIGVKCLIVTSVYHKIFSPLYNFSGG